MQKTLMMKLIAVMLVLMLSLSNFLVLVSYAAEILGEDAVDLFSQNSKTNNENVYFNSYLKVDGNKVYSAKLYMSDANKIYVNLNLENSGYLKVGIIKFEDTSFKIKKQDEIVNTIQNIDYNKNEMLINQINGGTEIELELPIEIAKNEIFDVRNLNKNNKVIFSGTYVTEKGKEVNVEKEIWLNIGWDENIDVTVEQEITKYIKLPNNETLVELEVKSSVLENKMPLKETNIEIDIPELEGKYPDYANVVADKLLATKGKEDGLDFDKNSFEYNEEEHKVKIKVENLPNENNEISWKNGIDEYRIILIYNTTNENNLGTTTNSNLDNKFNTKLKLYVYGKTEIIEKNIETEINQTENIGNINEISVMPKIENIYKSFMYANSQYETEYKIVWNLSVGYANISDKIIISDNAENFVNGNEEKTDANENTYYKQTIICKQNFEKILGQEGYIKILNEAGEELVNITLQPTEEENIIVNYNDSNLNKIRIETSKPITEGNLQIEHIKEVKAQTNFDKELIRTFAKVENEVNLNVIYNQRIQTDVEALPTDESEAETVHDDPENISVEITNISNSSIINLLEPETKMEIKTNRDPLVTGDVNEDVELYVSLINNKIEYSLYNNPIINIKLPQEISYVKIKDINLVFEDELTVQDTELLQDEAGIKYIKITLNGSQTKYNIGSIINGASLIITADMALQDIEKTKEAKIEAICTNEGSDTVSKVSISLVKIELPEVEEEPAPTQEQEIEEQPQEENQEQNINENSNKEEQSRQDEKKEESTQAISENNLNVKVSLESDKEKNSVLRWGEIITYKVTAKNYGENLKSSTLSVELPNEMSYMEEEETFEPIFYDVNKEAKKITWNLEELLIGREITREFKCVVNKEATSIKLNAQVRDNESEKYAVSNEITHNCIQGNISVQLSSNMQNMPIGAEDEFTYEVKIKEIMGEELSNIVTEMNISDGVNCYEAYILENNELIKDCIKIDGKKITVNINKLLSNEEKHIIFNISAKGIKENNDRTITAQSKVFINGDIYESNQISHKLSKPILQVNQHSNLRDNQATEDGIIKHVIEIKNIGIGKAENVKIEDNFSEGITYINTMYSKDGKIISNRNYAGNKSNIITSLEENESVIAVISVQALEAETNIENFVQVSAKGIDTITTEKEIYKINNGKENQVNNSVNNSLNNNETKKANISGIIWLDSNKDGIRESEEDKIGNIEVWLVNKNTNSQINVNTNSSGEYGFDNIDDGNYMLVFIYDTAKYSLTKPYANNIDEGLVSKGLRAEAQVNNETKVVALIENVNVQNEDISGLNVGLVENKIFDLSLNKVVDSITVKTKKGVHTYKANKKLAKVEIHSKEIEDAEVKITYRFDVKNEGDIEGIATYITENIPEELEINLEENPSWKIDEKRILYTESLANEKIASGETKSVYLTLTKTMTEDNTGIINNTAEITKTYNSMNLKDNDSIEGNQNPNEDDYSYANVYIGIKTGKALLYTSLFISVSIVLSTGIYLINKKVLQGQ